MTNRSDEKNSLQLRKYEHNFENLQTYKNLKTKLSIKKINEE